MRQFLLAVLANLVFSGLWRVEALFGNPLLHWFQALDLVRSVEPNYTTQVGSASGHVWRAAGGLAKGERYVTLET